MRVKATVVIELIYEIDPDNYLKGAYGGGRRGGKTAALKKYLHEWLKLNPKATVIRIRGKEMIVEKPIEDLTPAIKLEEGER